MPISDYLQHCEQLLKASQSKSELLQAVVDSPFSDPVKAAELFLGIVVLLKVNDKTKTIDRIALSNTHLAKGTLRVSVKKFKDIRIPLDYHDNILAEAIRTGKPQQTTDWQYLFAPALTPEEARFNQAGGGIGYSAVYPLPNAKGAMIFSYYQVPEDLGKPQRDFMKAYATCVDQALLAHP